MITHVQIRMARMGLGWAAEELAERAQVSVRTIRRCERGEVLKVPTLRLIQRALEAGGVGFFEDGETVGVRVPKEPAS